ncbi:MULTISPECIES: transglycosylase SLT domain-containing protein [unclassified Pseudomonas]|uniref:transglycosylase SLT domain-containing protein n=1 Tax=unclassified Pseudomonas TaxID=196821 RepID=UPI002AC9D1DF|nr:MULTISPECIES: transglycosylase SLT domain-containing protein [unclassified Pseudomonas]MEB0039986.1 transglycosylase SLT domain-containing protein [Pseudomonas sp. MH10]MEB0076383.1 transglycosylase SLT domain-containing protein [Pseudomonas sp. MH10out]MEB0092724.1 transglycosylase SLT domain-containing protein [Pseudomonas sp. CCI4.2]MEB0104620.1 transglycosylase SLT domain-containing protein [Pseudomonas sp. CCI3.2]MEB0128837.1 transglycosylase SLT domain-containing protein [Pseudomonas 
MTRPTFLIVICILALSPLPALARLTGPPVVVKKSQVRDLSAIRSSKVLRVLVNQSRNSSGEVQGEEIGVEYHRLSAFEQYLNGHSRDGQQLTLKIIPKSKDQLLAALQRGEGDLVAPGELLDTSAARRIDASAPVVSHVPLIVVGIKGEHGFKHIEQLSGRTVTLSTGSAADDAVRQLNQKLALRKLPPVKIEWVDPSLAVEDVLEMVQAGVYHLTVVEQPIAERWAKVMPKLRVDRSLVLSNSGDMNWYVRRDATMLRASINRFLKQYQVPSDEDFAFEKAYRGLYQVHYPLASEDRQRLEKLRPVLQRCADEQGMDWLNLAALAFKESALDPSARGAGNATGLLQITPSAAQRVGVDNIHNVDGNVLAGAKYLAMIKRKYFSSSKVNERERMAFVMAAYNLGPERVEAMRVEAKRRGLNPNQWFFQVERIAMEQVGMGVVSYVNSVNKYYLAFDRERGSLEGSHSKPLQQKIAFRSNR